MTVAISKLEYELQRAGLRVSAAEFQLLVIEAIRALPTTTAAVDPARELSEAEQEALLRGGVSPDESSPGTPDPRVKSASRYATLLASSYKVDEVAEMLGVDPSRIRQRLKERTIYGIKIREGWRIPRFQFDDGRLIPGIDQVVAALPVDLNPLSFFNWFTMPDPDFWIADISVSPADWLRHGGDLGRVVEVAASLGSGL